MRIIHTADWHLCDRLGRLDRTNDLNARVERVAELCEAHAADVLLIAGDLFSEQASVDDMTRALTRMHEVFAPFFARGGAVLAITGNHDRDGRINMVRAGMTLAAPAAGRGAPLPGGRMYLVNSRAIATLAGADGEPVQFVLVPYPFACRYDLSAAEYRTREEENRLLHGRVAEWVRAAVNQPEFDPRRPTVLTAHLYVRGAQVHRLYNLTERDDVVFDVADLNPTWAYAALGHIHQPQTLGGLPHVRYPGSLDRLAFDEMHDGHGVLLVEVGRGGLMGEPVHLPLPATPFRSIALMDPAAELPALEARFPDRETAIVRVTVGPGPCAISRDEIARTLRRLFPRLHRVDWAEAPAEDAAPARFAPRAGFATTVRDYLADRLAADPDRDAVCELAERYLRDGDEA